MDEQLLSEASDAYLAIARIARSIRRSGDTGALTPATAAALATLTRIGPARMSDLAAAERVSLPTMSRIIAALERTEFITRSEDPDDRRASLLAATPAGIELISGLTSARIQRFAAALNRLSDADRRALTSALTSLDRELAAQTHT
ncbi:MarR family transcriptional regulator [Skermania sp. ID1734]|uniref:MarR family winged helix-turn-helix transcriptional regulator n=1 Tax=Skermania sp. ID1734 TaxID=2597516 RepID=UPI00117E845C|nr:MarR family transcriptional regulator [Skermania sp. ID1734]TSD94281.1 MarR family transcriptional regulator [Skermania sp. ID1734]